MSTDEKTGIQALERFVQQAPLSKGGHQRKEFEYKRNGTTTLIAGLDVTKNEIVNNILNKKCDIFDNSIHEYTEESFKHLNDTLLSMIDNMTTTTLFSPSKPKNPEEAKLIEKKIEFENFAYRNNESSEYKTSFESSVAMHLNAIVNSPKH